MTMLAILSDLHGNSAATEAVLADIDAQAPDEVICLGDLVGYGAVPERNDRPDPGAEHSHHHGELR